MKTIVNGININYPDLGFAFNPIRLFITNYTQSAGISIEANGVTMKKEVLAKSVSFELSAVARAMFNRHEFYNVKEKDSVLLKTLSVKIFSGSVSLCECSIPVIWGALQIDELYTQTKKLTYFKGFPFTVPLYVENTIVLKIGDTEFKTVGPGKHNIDISKVKSNGVINIGLFDEKFHRVFDYTFDQTFGPQRVLIPNNMNIEVTVKECPNDGIYLRWINRHGEYNYYLFQSNTISTTTKNNSVVIDELYYTTALTNNYHMGTGKTIGKSIDESIKLFAPLVDAHTFDFLLGLVGSPVVDMFLGYNDKKVAKWVSVNISDGSFAKSTSNLQDFELLLIPNKQQVQVL